MNNLADVCSNFDISGKIIDIKPFGNGLINSTFSVCILNSKSDFILQKINHQIFKDIDLLQDNIKRITDHIRLKLTQEGETDIYRKTLTLIPTKDGKLYYFDGESYWRLTLKIEDSVTCDIVNSQYAYYAGVSFGKFQAMLSDIPGEPLGETIPNFHNMEYRLTQFREAVKSNAANRLATVIGLVQEVEYRAYEMCKCERLFREGKLPKRINHCDTKVNNLLFDNEGNVLCVIDLDTAMSGFVTSDFGDFMRTAANTGKEDDADLSKVSFDLDIFKSYSRGYLESAKSFLTPLEIELLPFGAKLLTYMQFVRFLTDYLNGDTYYKIDYESHNLIRSVAQLKLLQSIENKYDELNSFIKALI